MTAGFENSLDSSETPDSWIDSANPEIEDSTNSERSAERSAETADCSYPDSDCFDFERSLNSTTRSCSNPVICDRRTPTSTTLLGSFDLPSHSSPKLADSFDR